MYKIFGTQNGDKETLVGTAKTAREALQNYRASQKIFVRVEVLSPDGETINGFELNRLADQEREIEDLKAKNV